MSSTRFVFAATAALLAAHVAVLTVLGIDGQGPRLSNLTQLALGTICVGAPLLAARGSRGFEKRFLYLMSARYAIWAAAQAISVFAPGFGVAYQDSTANVLFHLDGLPLGVALLLEAPVDVDRPIRVRVSDLVPMAIFLGAIALYSVYSPTSPASGVGLLPSTDGLIAAGFFARAMITRSPLASALYGRWTPFLLLATINHAYAGHLAVIPDTGDLFDLVWSAENVVWIVTAATWRAMRDDDLADFLVIDPSVRRLPLVVNCFSFAMSLGVVWCKPAYGVVLLAAIVGSGALEVRALLTSAGPTPHR